MDLASEAVFIIFWKGDERPGIICYGYWPSADQPDVTFPSIWPAGTEHADTWLRNWQEDDVSWRVLRREVMLREWPNQDTWLECVQQTLQAFVAADARVAWCATEGHFADPPELFDPEGMEGAIWAFYGKGLDFQCAAHLGRPYMTLSNEALTALRDHAMNP